jgi:glycosidase
MNKITLVTLAVGTVLSTLQLTGCDLDFDDGSKPEQRTDGSNGIDENVVDESFYGRAEVYKQRKLTDEIFYHIFLDRFANGDPSNDNGEASGLYSGGYQPDVLHFYHGGDLQGVIDKLDYLEGLGVTALWLSPIYKGVATESGGPNYHGYLISDFLNVDPHLGTNELFKTLVDDAHSRGIKIYLDAVASQTTNAITYAEPCGLGCEFRPLSEPAYTPVYMPGLEDVKNPAWLNDLQYYHHRGQTYHGGPSRVYGDFSILDGLDTTNPFVQQGMVDIYAHWITEYGIDGFRLDTVPYNPVELWTLFGPATRAIAAENGIPNFSMFGEVAYEPAQVASIYSRKGQLDSTLDFNIYGSIGAVFAASAPPNALAHVFDSDDYYNDTNSNAYQQISFASNHDFGRFGTLLVQNQGNQSEDQLLSRYQQALAFLFFGRGVPLIYQGDEQGMSGFGLGTSNDGDNRQDMFPSQVTEHYDHNLIGSDQTVEEDNFNTQHPLYLTIAEYSALYKAHPALRNGIQWARYADEKKAGALVISRIDRDSGIEYVVAFNNSHDAVTATFATDSPDSQFNDILNGEESVSSDINGQLSLSIPPLGVLLYQADKPTVAPNDASIDIALVDNVLVNDTFHVPVNLKADAIIELEIAVSTDGSNFQTVALDDAPPYGGYVDTTNFPDGEILTIRATATERDGNQLSAVKTVMVENRKLSSLTTHYENANQRSEALVYNNDGDLLERLTLDGSAAFDIPLNSEESAVFIVFQTRNGEDFAFDAPVYIPIKALIESSQSNGSGGLEAEIFINNLSQWSLQNNFEQGNTNAVATLDSAESLASPQMNGSYDVWSGGGEPPVFVGESTFKQLILMNRGEHEMSLSLSDGRVLSADLDEGGLVENGHNATITIQETNYYDVYFTQFEHEGESYAFYQYYPSTEVPIAFDVPIYVRGINGDWGFSPEQELVHLGDNHYEVSFDTTASSQSFKIASEDWNVQYGIAAVEVGERTEMPVSCCVEDAASITFPSDGSYLFSLDASEPAKVFLTVSLEE